MTRHIFPCTDPDCTFCEIRAEDHADRIADARAEDHAIAAMENAYEAERDGRWGE